MLLGPPSPDFMYTHAHLALLQIPTHTVPACFFEKWCRTASITQMLSNPSGPCSAEPNLVVRRDPITYADVSACQSPPPSTPPPARPQPVIVECVASSSTFFGTEHVVPISLTSKDKSVVHAVVIGVEREEITEGGRGVLKVWKSTQI
ncbi:hypothetical protein D9757_014852 [Collybiopsis confluens]|uniref:Uncharacterized protein n=1 Tax=Collybiopsis confluens TaxID=2823264 RepID=A0A8H5FKG2_9AGAR|nr:hypothetical protein D9757_014852 [Collybiopsis confluens]